MSRFVSLALLLAASGLFQVVPASAQTYTSPSSATFTNPMAWNFGAGSFGIWGIPASSDALALRLQSYGSTSISVNNDLNLTLNRLNLNAYATNNILLSSTLGGNFAFAGSSGASIHLLGSGSSTTLSAGMVLSSGLGSQGLTIDGAGASPTTMSGAITSNTAAGAPVTIATDARNAGTGVVMLSGANSFKGGVVLSSGTLALGSARALGDITNTLTVNGGSLRSGAGVTVSNNVVLNAALNVNTATALTLGGQISGSGQGLNVRPAGATSGLTLTGVNSYTGATLVGTANFAQGALDGAGALALSGAAGSLASTAGITVRDGAQLNLGYNTGASASNSRVSTANAISTQSGFLQVIGHAGIVTQSLGTVTAGGLTTLAALTNGAGTVANGAGTQVTVGNLVRGTRATLVFQGPNLGGAAVAAGTSAAQGNVLLSQINSTTPSAALVGGGGAAGSTTISILPWALGDTANASQNYAGVSGFVTYDTNGVRLLNTTTEYNTSNNFTSVTATQNVRVTGAITSHTTATTVNSLFFASTGQTLAGGANALTITSGALASNVAAATISNAVLFGTGGTGEAVISVTGGLTNTNSLTLSGGFTAASLTKSGHGDLVIATTNPTISGGITINGGEIVVDAMSRLGGATSITVNGSSQSEGRAGLLFTHTGGNPTLSTPIITQSGSAGIRALSAGGSMIVNSDISGAGGMNYSASSVSAVFSITGTNSYTGPTFVSGVTLSFDGTDTRLGSNGDPNAGFLNLNAGALRLTGSWTSARAIHVSNTSILDTGANNAVLSGPITGNSSLIKNGSGTLEMTSGVDSSYTGVITLGSVGTEGGTLKLSGNGALNSAGVTFGPAAVGVAGTYVLDLSAAADIDTTDGSTTAWRSLAALNTGSGFTQAHSVQLGSTALAPVDLRVDNGTFGGAAGVITGFGKLVKVGTGTLTLNGSTASSFTGGVEVWGGTLAFGADNQFGDSGNTITLAGGILSNSSTVTTSRGITLAATPRPILDGSGSAVTLGNGLNTGTGTSLTLNGAISGSGGFNKSGAGTLTLGTTNSYTGDTQITAGVLAFTNDNQLGGAGSRLRLNGGTLSLDAAPVSATTYPLARPVILTAASTLNVVDVDATLSLDAPLVGNQALTKRGPGSLRINADNAAFFNQLVFGNGIEAAGNVTLTSSGQLRRVNITFNTTANVTFDMSGLVRETGGFSINPGSTLALGSAGAITTGFTNPLFVSGSITGGGAASVTLVGTGSHIIASSTSTFGGGFHLLSGFSTTTMSSTGTLPLQSAFTLGGWGNASNQGASLTLDNTTNLGTRLANTQVIHSNAGSITFTTNTITATSETAGSLRGAGQTTVTFSSGTSHGGTLNFGDVSTGLTRLQRGTFLFRAENANMGTGVASTTVANLTFGNSGSLGLIGGGGGAGTTTISILPYAVGGTFGGDSGSNFVTYGANGIRVLNTTTEVQSNLTSATATENVLMNDLTPTTTSLTSDLTVNALNIGMLVTGSTARIQSTGTEKLILTSGLLISSTPNVWTTDAAAPYARQLGIHTAELRTGGSNSQELHVWTVGDLFLGSKITTSGGLTKSGVAALYLTNTTNSYTGPTTVNAGNLVIDSLAALGGSTTLQMGGGFLKYRGPSATLTQSIVAAGGEAGNPNGGSAGLHIVGGTTLTVGGTNQISGFGGLYKEGTGALLLSAAQSYSGPTIISGGTLAITSAAALGSNSRVIFSSGGVTTGGQTLRFDANNLTLTQDFITNTSQVGIGFGFDTNGNNATLSGTILSTTSTRGLYKFGAGNLTLTATQMYTGATQVFGGTLTLSGADGSVSSSTGTSGFVLGATTYIAPGAALVLDNAAANNNNRLPDVWDTPFGTGNGNSGKLLMNGGEFKVIGHSGGTQERINQFDILTGTVTLDADAGGSVQLVSGRFFRTSAQSAGLIRGTNLGATSGVRANWFLTDLGSGGTQLGGAGGAEGTPFVNLIPGFAGDASASGSGTDLVTYAADTGIRLLTSAEYTNVIPGGVFDLSRAPIVALTSGDSSAVNETTAITALKLGPGAALNGTGTLYLGQSTILATGSATINVPVLSSAVTGSNGGVVFLTSGSGTTLTVNSAIRSGSLYKHGEGTLLLNQPYLANSGINVAQGTLKLGPNGSLAPLTASLVVQPGAVFDLNGADRVIASLSTTQLVGTFNLGQISDGTVALGANRLTLYDGGNGLFTGSITGSGGLTKAFFSTGTSTFTQPLAYTGSTLIRAGTLRLGGAGTLASTAIELRGGSLTFTNTDDNGAAGGYIANRIGTSVPVTVAGGTITFEENVHTPASHSLGAVTLAGQGTLTITQSGAAPSTTTIANLTRGSGGERGTLTISATNLGLTQSPTGNARVFATQIHGAAPASALIGGGGAVGTTTQSILPWGWSSTAGSFLTYGADGLRPLVLGTEYASNLLTATATDNVRTLSANTLTAAKTVNSLISGGAITGAFDLTLESGALAMTASNTIGVNTNTLLTGAGNTRELVINAAGNTFLNYNLTTSGGVTKFGTSPLILGGTANTFQGGLTINQGAVEFTSDAQLGTSGGGIRMGAVSSTTISDGRLQYTGTTPLAFSRPVESTSFGGFSGPANVLWQLGGVISGPGGVGYVTNNTLYEITAVNTYTGPTSLVGGSNTFIYGDSAFGNGGDLFANNSSTQGVIMRGDWTTSRLIHIQSSGLMVQTGGHTATWNGTFTGAGALTKTGLGSLILTQPATNTSSNNTVSAGSLVLRGNGALSLNSVIVQSGASLVLDDTAGRFPDRLSDADPFVLSGGKLTLLGSSSGISEEVIGRITFNVGPSTVTLTPGSGQAAILRVNGPFLANTGSSILFRGENLGVNTPGTTNSANLVFTDTARQSVANYPLTGGGAPAGHPSISIIRGGFGDTSSTGLGTQLVTYDLDKGVRLLDPNTEYTTTLVDGSIVTDNVKIQSATITNNAPTTANALWFNGSATLAGTGTTTLTGATVLVTGTGNTVSGILNSGLNNLAIGGPGNITIGGANDRISGSGGLTKMGAGTLTLTDKNSYTGTTYLHSGTVNLGVATALGNGSSIVRFLDAELRNTSGSPMTLANPVNIDGVMRVGGSQDLTFSNTVILTSASREINVTNTGLTTLSGNIASSINNNDYGLIKSGAGLLLLSKADGNTYTGPTTVSQGELRITNTIGNALSTGAITVAAGATLSGDGSAHAGINNIVINGTLSIGNNNSAAADLGLGTTTGFGKSLTLGATGSMKFALFSGAGAGDNTSNLTASDLLLLSGDISILPGAQLIIENPTGMTGWANGDMWRLWDAVAIGETRTGGFGLSQIIAPALSGGLGWYFDTATGILTVGVPEPSRALLILLGLSAALFRRRRS